MNFISPSALFLLFIVPIIIVLYLLKLRRVEQVVSSVYLWKKMVRDLEANAPWQRLQKNILMFLQLLVLISLIIALARPFSWQQGFDSQSIILIIDISASMAATDVKPNRLEAAKNQAQQIMAGSPDGARFTIIAAGREAQVKLASSLDLNLANQAIEDLMLDLGSSNLDIALQLAAAIAARQPETEIVILSDGRVRLPDKLALNGNLRYLPVGISSNNQAINLLNLEVNSKSDSATALAQVTNYSDTTASRRLVINADGLLANAFDLTLEPGESKTVLAEGLPVTTQLVEAQLISLDNSDDDLPIDDHAFAVQRKVEPAKVVLITQGNYFLETALTFLPGIQLEKMQPSQVGSLPTADLTIFDMYVPITTTLPQGNLLFISPPSSTELFTVTGLIETPLPRPASESEDLLNNVSLESINILDSMRILLPQWARPIIIAEDIEEQNRRIVPLLFSGQTGSRKVAVLAFDIRHSDLPLQLSFPILMANLMSWLAPGIGGDIPTQVNPGTPISFTLPPVSPSSQEVSRVRIVKPDGSSIDEDISSGKIVFTETNLFGLYHIEWGDTSIEFAANLFSPQESDIRPAESLNISGINSDSKSPIASQARNEWWRWLAIIALSFLTIEWIIYHRPTLVRLSKHLLSWTG